MIALFGVTVDDVTRVEALARSLAALPRRPTTRLYLKVHEPAGYYVQPAARIHSVSAVMGELLDSSEEEGDLDRRLRGSREVLRAVACRPGRHLGGGQ